MGCFQGATFAVAPSLHELDAQLYRVGVAALPPTLEVVRGTPPGYGFEDVYTGILI